MKKLLMAAAGGALLLCGQTVINGSRSITGKWDASAATSTLPVQVGLSANLPATCAVGQMYFASDGAAGKKLQSCGAANAWTAVAYEQGAVAAKPAACTVGQIYFATNATAGQNLYFCTAANVWTQMTGASVGATPYSCAVSGVSTVSCTHNLGTSQPWVACYDSGGNMLGGASASTMVTSVAATSANTATIGFSAATTGMCVISTGSMGPAGVAGPTGAQGPAGAGSGDVLQSGSNVMSGYTDFHSGRVRLPEATFAAAPTSPATGQFFLFTDAASSGTCAGGGSSKAQCRWTGSAWEAVGGGSGGGANYQAVIGAGPLGAGSNATVRTQRAALQARDNLVFDDDGTNTILNFTTLDARVVNIDEDFVGQNLATPNIGNYGWKVSGTGCALQGLTDSNQNWANPGVINMHSGATSGNVCAIGFNGNTTASGQLGSPGSNANWGFLWVFKIGATTNINLRIGMGTSNGTLGLFDYNSMMGLRYDDGDANFQYFVKGASGSDAVVSTGVAADTAFHTVLVYSTTAGTIRMSLDGGAEKTFCASGCDGTVTVPTAFMDPIAQIKPMTNAAQDLFLDAFKYKARPGTGSVNKRN